MENPTKIALVALVLAIIACFLPAGNGKTVFGNVIDTSYFDYFDATLGYKIGGTTFYSAASGFVNALLTQTDGGLLQSYTNSTSTLATSQTLVQADILNYSTILMTPNTASLTLTMPATSTLTSFVPTVGDRQDVCFLNSTSTSATTITFVAGTGMNIQTASSTTNIGIPPIQPRGTGCFTFIRDKNTDINAAYTRFVDGD